MDFFQKLFGYKEPTLIVAESDNWTQLEPSHDLDVTIARRARKEKWPPTSADAPAEFHCMLIVHGAFSDGYLEVNCLGKPIATFNHEQVADTMERMRADNGLRMTAVKTTAFLDADRWIVTVNI